MSPRPTAKRTRQGTRQAGSARNVNDHRRRRSVQDAGKAAVASDPNRMLSLDEAAALAGLSRDSLRRHYSHIIQRLTPRRLGVWARDLRLIGTTMAFNTSTVTSTAVNATLSNAL